MVERKGRKEVIDTGDWPATLLNEQVGAARRCNTRRTRHCEDFNIAPDCFCDREH